VEWTNHYKPTPWLAVDVDVAATRARFTDAKTAGDRIPGAPVVVASAGVVVGQALGWFGGAKVRYFGPRPLIEDDSVRSDPTVLVSAHLGYRWAGGWRAQLDVLNLLDAKANQIDYFYESQLRTEAGPVADRHIHPVEPLALRVTLAGPLP
jgi:outer membrane receptor protein involved in Fe transport